MLTEVLITYTPADRAAARRLSALLAWESLLRDPYAGMCAHHRDVMRGWTRRHPHEEQDEHEERVRVLRGQCRECHG